MHYLWGCIRVQVAYTRCQFISPDVLSIWVRKHPRVVGPTGTDHIAAAYRLVFPQLQRLFKEKFSFWLFAWRVMPRHLGCRPVAAASHLAVSSQLHSLQPDHHLLGADASRRVPLTPSFQLHIPDEHKTFRGFHCTNHLCERGPLSPHCSSSFWPTSTSSA